MLYGFFRQGLKCEGKLWRLQIAREICVDVCSTETNLCRRKNSEFANEIKMNKIFNSLAWEKIIQYEAEYFANGKIERVFEK